MKLRGVDPKLLSPKPNGAVQTEQIVGDVAALITRKKEEWLEYHMRKLLGDEVANMTQTQPAVVRAIMKERGIWLKTDGGRLEIMQEDKSISLFLLEVKP